MAALALVMAACGSDDNVIEQQPAQQQAKMHFTATIAAPNSGATTRTTYTEDGTSINVAWKSGDQIALIHGGVKDVVTVGTPNPDGSAPISGDITVGANDETVVLAYPAAAVSSATPSSTFPFTPNPTCWDKAHAQDGTLEFIQNNIDFRMGSGKLAVSGDPATASLKANVSMPSMISIWKLTLQDNTSAALSATAVTVKANGELVAGATSTAKSAYYLCMVPSFIPAGDLVIEATDGSDTYTYTKAGGVSLETSKYYQSTVTMTKQLTYPITLSAVTNDYIGSVVTTDGNVYATVAAVSAASKTAAAMIAYVSGTGHGLALALENEGFMDWSTAKTTCEAHTPAVTGGTWQLPSRDDWNNMITAAGSYTALRDGFSSFGGTNMNASTYWSSTDAGTMGSIQLKYGYKFHEGQGSWGSFGSTSSQYTRACLAF